MVRSALLGLMGLSVVAHFTSFTPVGQTLGPVDDAIGFLGPWTAAALCWRSALRVRRPEFFLASAALTSFATGATYALVGVFRTGEVPFPSPADAGYLLFPPLMMSALVVLLRRQSRGVASPVWLDSAVGALGAAAALAVVLSPVLSSALSEQHSWATAVAVAYPLGDLILIAGVIGMATLPDVQLGRRWPLLLVGLVLFTAADVLYALRQAAGTFEFGSWSDAGWAGGLVLMALWVDGARRDPQPRPAAGGPATSPALAVPAVATAAGLAVLVVGTRTSVSTLAVVLAAVTLFAAAARTQLAFRQLVKMADLRRQATTDELTGLPNRRALYAELQHRVGDPDRHRVALLLLDLDKFKEVNDSLGHHVGDQMLVGVGRRLRDALRPGDVLARLGGDEFAVLLDGADQVEAVAVARKLREALAAPFTLEGIALRTGASVGISLFPLHGGAASALLRMADIAMYKAKSARTGHRVYSLSDDAQGDARLRTLEELRRALDRDELVLHYQPKVDLDTGAVRGVEALVRWDHPTRGLLYPDAFLTMVEDAGLMHAMTQTVLHQGLDQAATWRQGGRPLTVAVNLSASSLVDADLPEQVEGMLAARGLPAGDLQLEITEEFLMADRDRARAVLTRLRRMGVQIAVDDFGTGYSSLAYLRDLPIDELKLDRSFVFPMADDARAAALVASTIALAHSLSLRMVAEGVENHVAYAELARHGCDQAQGYYVCRPVPAAELDHWLDARERPRAPAEGLSAG